MRHDPLVIEAKEDRVDKLIRNLIQVLQEQARVPQGMGQRRHGDGLPRMPHDRIRQGQDFLSQRRFLGIL